MSGNKDNPVLVELAKTSLGKKLVDNRNIDYLAPDPVDKNEDDPCVTFDGTFALSELTEIVRALNAVASQE